MDRLVAEIAMVAHFAFPLPVITVSGPPQSGFIDYHIEGVIHPGEYPNVARLAVAVAVVFAYVGYVLVVNDCQVVCTN
ncbi:hypothetical protein [Nonomuraea lactucae]|uniref:hypothetical protein n=1 Tax=Nonomuraea lactucae TaxID=2249762 RepID=UPI00196669F5|nr:hypothetical protein [Nonomuraea lactucae]